MKKKTCIFIIFIFCSVLVSAQKKTDTNIFGHVVNKVSKEHIPFINISIKGTTLGTVVDASGHYYLKNLPVGHFHLVASGIGYKTVEKEVILTEGISLEINFELEEDRIMLESVVITANRNETNRKESAAIVNILSSKIFENTNSLCLAQGLNFQPGLRVETNCQNCGFQQVRINGLEGPYSQILIDSRPVFSALAGVYGIEQIPANMIERVEIVRGGGSSLFGSNAIAGTINIITKEPSSNSVSLSSNFNSIYGRKPDIFTSLNATTVSENNKSGLVFFGSTRQRSPFDYDGDGFTEIGKMDAKNIGFRGYYKTSNYSKLTLEYHNLSEFRRGGNNLDLPPHNADIGEQTEHNLNTGGIKFDIFSKSNKHRLNIYSSVQKLDRDSYYGAQKDLNAYGSTYDLTYVAGMQYTFNTDTFLFLPSILTIGSEYSDNFLKDEMLGYNRTIEQAVKMKSLYLQNEWKNEKISILLGSRFDKHNLIKDPVISPRLNLRYNPYDFLNFRISYSNGFRAPQTFDEDLHVNAVGGNAVLVQVDPDLKTERSRSYSASTDIYKTFGAVQTNLLIEGFHTDLENIFYLEEIGTDADGNIILERRNGSGAIVNGINIEGKLATPGDIQLQFGATFQKSEYRKNQKWSNNENLKPHRKMFRSPGQYGYLTATFKPFNKINISLSGIYTGSMLVQHFAGYISEDTENKTPEFYEMNLKVTYNIILRDQLNLQLNTGLQNIFNSYQEDFDKGEFRDAGYIYGPSLPRTVFVGVKFVL